MIYFSNILIYWILYVMSFCSKNVAIGFFMLSLNITFKICKISVVCSSLEFFAWEIYSKSLLCYMVSVSGQGFSGCKRHNNGGLVWSWDTENWCQWKHWNKISCHLWWVGIHSV